ncbi:MAG: Ig-like domain-containing protein [candidate division KSB1 bacterium]|nr:Ig-like domain-containing protein [candidate division KSB1 bacterium]MDZ7303137.1 Ig-like domain-containing protein [candidate division KSB1 bacterium]MDZ7310118.1 Ig-like domain-containing protein [candidate division KSB1 bacterium]
MKRFVLSGTMIALTVLMTDKMLAQVIVRDTVVISSKCDISNSALKKASSDCGAPLKQLALFPIYAGRVTFTVQQPEFTIPGLQLGPLYISDSRFLYPIGDTLVFIPGLIQVGDTISREITVNKEWTIWLVFGALGQPDTGPNSVFQVIGDYPDDFDFFYCADPIDNNEPDPLLKFVSLHFKQEPFPVDHFDLEFVPSTISPGGFTFFWIHGKDKYDNFISPKVRDTTFVNVTLDGNGAQWGGLTLEDPHLAPTTYTKLENIPAGSQVYFISNGTAPTLPQTITITNTKNNNPNISGVGNFVLQGKTIRLEKPSDSGDEQVACINSPLAKRLKVRAAEANGNGVEGITIAFAVASKPADATGEAFSNSIVVTDANGVAHTQFIIGNKPGQYAITATSAEVGEGSPQSFTVFGAKLEILNAALTVTDHVQVARWDNAYDQFMQVSDNFIDFDPERFFVRVTDLSKNTAPEAVDKVTTKIGTLTANGDLDDNPTEIELFETGNNTGIFDSKSQLLMSEDLPFVEVTDDGFPAYDGISGIVTDDAPNDRTHRATRDGSVKAEYELPDGGKCLSTVSVCQRSPDERRRLEIRVRVFNEPFDDIGYDHDNIPITLPLGAGNGVFDFKDLNANGVHDLGEPSEPYRDISAGISLFLRGNNPLLLILGGDGRGGVVTDAYVQAQIKRANIAWGQACIQIVQVGATIFVDAPKDAKGKDILSNGEFNRPDEILIVHNTYRPGRKDILDVFFAAPIRNDRDPIGHTAGMAISDKLLDFIEFPFTVIAPNVEPQWRTLAHEIGHILSLLPDTVNPKPIFFPQLVTSKDITVTQFRRITKATADACHSQGTSLLKTP